MSCERGFSEKERYFDDLAPTWDHRPTADADTIDRILSFVDIRPGAAVLDLGTGTGLLIPHLLGLVGDKGHVYAVDISAGMLNRVRQRIDPFPPNLSLVRASAENLPFPDASMNNVICFAAFPHFDDKVAALKEMRRVLKPDGVVLIAHARGRHAINRMHRTASGPIAHDLVPAPRAMRALLREAGLMTENLIDRPDLYLVVARSAASGRT
ncbi:MAG TPA: methyltransferase domain-containing protein [Clostridia bacterium]|nr:methyltransferase domain-containing protein [Clostridia bacterium]